MNGDERRASAQPVDPVAEEHARRERAWCPTARWKVLQETIRWAEMQTTARRNTPRACIERERRLLCGMGRAD